MSGIFDFAAKTAEGLTNTVTTFDDKPRESRIRPPRAFYDKWDYFKEYD